VDHGFDQQAEQGQEMSKRYLGVCIAMIVAIVIVAAFLYQGLPERVPLHWNYSGQVDKHGPKWIMWLLGPGVLALLFGLGVLAPRLQPARYSLERSRAVLGLAVAATMGFWAFAFLCILAAIDGVRFHMGQALMGGTFILLIVIGNPMGKVKPNRVLGIRTPWTLADERVWYATHRSAARWMVGVGIAGLLLLATPAPHWVALVLLVAWPVVPVVQSYLLARKNR
jgi:uncharacterized membrane protein